MISEELFEKLEEMKWDYINGKKYPTGLASTQWIHLQDAVDRGTVTPMEAYDALKLGYVPAHLKVRESRYSHLLTI